MLNVEDVFFGMYTEYFLFLTSVRSVHSVNILFIITHISSDVVTTEKFNVC